MNADPSADLTYNVLCTLVVPCLPGQLEGGSPTALFLYVGIELYEGRDAISVPVHSSLMHWPKTFLVSLLRVSLQLRQDPDAFGVAVLRGNADWCCAVVGGLRY